MPQKCLEKIEIRKFKQRLPGVMWNVFLLAYTAFAATLFRLVDCRPVGNFGYRMYWSGLISLYYLLFCSHSKKKMKY